MDNLITEALENVDEERRAIKVKILEELVKAGDRLSEHMIQITDDIYQIQQDMDLVAADDFVPSRNNINKLKSSNLCGNQAMNVSLSRIVLGDF